MTWNAIQRHAETITIRRGATTLAPQTVRIEQNLRVREDVNETSTMGVAITVVIGLRDHPTLPDTNIRPRDRFVLHGVEYEVTTIIEHPGEVQAVLESRYS